MDRDRCVGWVTDLATWEAKQCCAPTDITMMTDDRSMYVMRRSSRACHGQGQDHAGEDDDSTTGHLSNVKHALKHGPLMLHRNA